MKITKDNQDELVIRHNPGIVDCILLIAAGFLAYKFFEIIIYTPENTKDTLAAGLGSLFFLLAFILFYEKSEFRFNLISRRIFWKRHRLFRSENGIVSFTSIHNVITQYYFTGNSSLNRVMLNTNDSDIKLSSFYLNNTTCDKIAERIRTILELSSSDTILDSVSKMVINGNELEAVKLLQMKKNISLTQAKEEVKNIKEKISTDLRR